ncbi:hypothetical protein FDP41_008284 [Naegleria fowleri]|uniref:Metallo-beta-lactamase domain-containing protein n=1 Tax=Naegleria fowleri TaxID=5763 RepID=A0A6A5BHS7_NAEFO|nr:uncharacterized protein FDP41_008284 [Naegleria fowleri]KAF0973580.1 hypothetical protein FDP41_008284 [Naegleria fowleri]
MSSEQITTNTTSTTSRKYLFSEVTIQHVCGGSSNNSLQLLLPQQTLSSSTCTLHSSPTIDACIPSHWVVSDRKKKSLLEFFLSSQQHENQKDLPHVEGYYQFLEPDKFVDPWIGISHDKSIGDYFSMFKYIGNRPSIPSDEELPQLEPHYDLLFHPKPFQHFVEHANITKTSNTTTATTATTHENSSLKSSTSLNEMDTHIDYSKKTYQITWIGHSTFLIQYRGINILTDPVFAERCSPVSFFGPKRIKKIPVDDISKLPPIHFVCVSHNHYDHLCETSIRDIQKYHDPIILLPYKCKYKWMQSGCLNQEKMNSKLYELDWWKDVTFKVSAKISNTTMTVESEIRFVFLPAQHWGARNMTDRNEALWGSWGIEFNEIIPNGIIEQQVGKRVVKFWHAGDTGYNTQTFTEIGKRLGPIDLALIPIGAYHPRSFLKDQHVDPEEAITIAQEVGAKKSIGMHWGTFMLTFEPVMEPKQLLEKGLIERKLPTDYFITMKHGETIVDDFDHTQNNENCVPMVETNETNALKTEQQEKTITVQE